MPGEHGSSDDAQPFLYTRLNPSVEINTHPQPDLAIIITIMPKGTIFTRHPRAFCVGRGERVQMKVQVTH
jgi:hypothetical protein